MIQEKYYWPQSLKAAAVAYCLKKDFPLHIVSSFRLAAAGELSIHKGDQEVEYLQINLPGIYDLLPSSFVDESIHAGNADFRQLYRNNTKRELRLRQYFSPLDQALLDYQQTWHSSSMLELIFRLYGWKFREREAGKMLAFYELLPGTTSLMVLLGEMVGAKMQATVDVAIVFVNLKLCGDGVLGECSYLGNCYSVENVIMHITVEVPFPEAYTAWMEGGDKRCYLEELLACKIPVEWEIAVELVADYVSGTLPARLDFDLFVN